MDKTRKEESPLVSHAKLELSLSGIDAPDADYDGAIATAIMELIEVFASQGHSGFSAEMTLDIFWRLVHFKPLSSLTDDPTEWREVTEVVYSQEQAEQGMRMWQSTRLASVFSEDNGKTWIDKETNEKGTSVPKEERDAALKEQAVQASTTENPREAKGIKKSRPSQELQNQPTTEPGTAPEVSDEKESGSVGGVEPTVGEDEQPDSDKQSKRSPSHRGGKKKSPKRKKS